MTEAIRFQSSGMSGQKITSIDTPEEKRDWKISKNEDNFNAREDNQKQLIVKLLAPKEKTDMLELKQYYSRHHNLVLKREDDTTMWMSVKDNFMNNEMPMLKHVREEIR